MTPRKLKIPKAPPHFVSSSLCLDKDGFQHVSAVDNLGRVFVFNPYSARWEPLPLHPSYNPEDFKA